MSSKFLDYSSKALEAKSLFYGKKTTIYVEGGEDEIYWDKIVGDDTIHIESVNGLERLITYMDNIVDNDAKFIVACDLDHAPFKKDYKYVHVRIVSTYGYSIENSMYCTEKINNLIRKACRKRTSFKKELDVWLKEFTDACIDLLKFDIANYRYSKGVKIFGDSCSNFLKNRNSNEISHEAIQRFIKEIENKFDNDELKEVEELIVQDKRELKFLIKGHFLSLAVINTIKKHVKNELNKKNFNFSQENLFSETCHCIGQCTNSCLPIKNERIKMKYALNSL